MKRSMFVFMALLCAQLPLHADRKSDCVDKFPDRKCSTCASTPISKSTIIKNPGVYCLTQDIAGPITIESNDVVLDLNSHVVDGLGGPYGIYTTGHYNITIKNGSVTNVGQQAMGVTFTNGFVLEDVQVFNSNRALILASSKNSEIRSLYAYNNVNTIGPIVLIENCNTVRADDLQISNNYRGLTRLSPGLPYIDPFAADVGIVAVNISQDVVITNSSSNQNSRNTDAGRGAGFAVLTSSNVSLINCEANRNTTPINVTDTQGFAGYYVYNSSSITLDNCEANQNSVVTSDSFLSGIYVIGARNMIINDSSTNLNAGGKVGYGIYVTGIIPSTALLAREVVINNCTANDNSSVDFAVGYYLGGIPAVGDEQPIITYSADCNIIDSQADRNTASLGNAYGIVLQNARRCHITGCQTNFNKTTGILAGNAVGDLNEDVDCINLYCVIKDCVAIENGDNGFEMAVVQENNGFLWESNIALDNDNIGFLHSPAVLTSRYLSNYAQDNFVDNYDITGGVIQLFSLNSLGIYTPVTGDTTLTHLTNIEAIP